MFCEMINPMDMGSLNKITALACLPIVYPPEELLWTNGTSKLAHKHLSLLEIDPANWQNTSNAKEVASLCLGLLLVQFLVLQLEIPGIKRLADKGWKKQFSLLKKKFSKTSTKQPPVAGDTVEQVQFLLQQVSHFQNALTTVNSVHDLRYANHKLQITIL
ncbi:hypothetical protein Moror_11832 [Moniliophthora roreri MCA 2997]|uniref:Uncharacterized protein n=1 Tax=Moniliophthora roreri (strain MCA 2997) TaxID=1381753 RepID=V2WRT5_MONRO|nr:hypothetical protein Moror_11832 [Moniliophthora roreri MCA 2997]